MAIEKWSHQSWYVNGYRLSIKRYKDSGDIYVKADNNLAKAMGYSCMQDIFSRYEGMEQVLQSFHDGNSEQWMHLQYYRPGKEHTRMVLNIVYPVRIKPNN